MDLFFLIYTKKRFLMSATFSINIGTIIESTRKADIFGALSDIQDNTQKLISPKDVRDAVLTTWSNTPFKVTIPNSLSGLEYIGIDSSNPNNRDIKQKILLGKRSYGGLDIMSTDLITSNTDIFIFNTKEDSLSQNSTKISILAGTNSTLYANAPYIESYCTQSRIDLNLINPADNGGVNLQSKTGRVALNGIIFPGITESRATALEGMILRYQGTYPKGQLKWEFPTISYNIIGSTGSKTDIYGEPVNVNGYSLEFIDNNLVSATMGGVPMGFSFSEDSFTNSTGGKQNWPLTETLRKLLYPYVPPVLALSTVNIENNTIYAEVGKPTNIKLDYSITTYAKNVDETITYKITNNNNQVVLAPTTFYAKPGTSTDSTILISMTASHNTFVSTWTLSVRDTSLLSFSYSTSKSIHFIKPILYGFTASANISSSVGFNKSITPYPGASNSVILKYNGEGYLYFMHDTSFAPLKKILDPNGYVIYSIDHPQISAFTHSTGTINEYNANNGGGYVIWRTKLVCGYPGGDFKFIF